MLVRSWQQALLLQVFVTFSLACAPPFAFCSLLGIKWLVSGLWMAFLCKAFTHWYSQSERGRWWSFWNASHNIGGALIPILTAWIAQYYGWRFAMGIPGILSIIMGFILLNRLTDTPQSLGLPPIEKFRNDYPSAKSKEKERELSVKEILFKYVLSNPLLWVLGGAYFFVYIIREAMNAWSLLYLVEAKGYAQLKASSVIFWLDIGGMCGGIFAGWASDKLFNARRVPVTVIYSLGIAAVLLFAWGPAEQNYLLDCATVAATGFFIYGPQMLIGMAAAELSHKKAAATASGFTGWMGYLGSAVAGYPLGVITQNYGWTGFVFTLTICAALAALFLSPLWKARSSDFKLFGKQEPEAVPQEVATQVQDKEKAQAVTVDA